MDKKTIRHNILKNRSSLSLNLISQKSFAICKKITKLKKYQNSKKIAIYYPLASEVDLRVLMELSKDKTFLLPRVKDSKLIFLEYSINDHLVMNSKLKILEPEYRFDKSIINMKEIDIILVPTVAFDASKNRIGYGKGFYDRTLSEFNGLKIGVAFSLQQVPKIPAELFDIPMDLIVNEDIVF